MIAEGGISNYSRPLIERLIEARSPGWKFDLLFRLGFRNSRAGRFRAWAGGRSLDAATIRTSGCPDRLSALFCHFGDWGGLLGNHPRPDVFLATTDLIPHSRSARVGWFVYDLIPLKTPQFFKGSLKRFRNAMRSRAQRADFILALSECTRKDVVELLEYPAEKIAVVYPGLDLPLEVQRREAGSPNQNRPYILYLGALALNKNVDGLLRVFARCIYDHHLDLDLVLTGKDFCGARHWGALVQRLGITNRVRFTGWVSDFERESLLSNAVMLWQFSWYEGFGLPVMEAAGRGVPVLCTNRGAVPEILRNPDQEVDPADEVVTAERAAMALKSPAILEAWKERGLKRASEFTWSRSVEQLAAAIEAVV